MTICWMSLLSPAIYLIVHEVSSKRFLYSQPIIQNLIKTRLVILFLHVCFGVGVGSSVSGNSKILVSLKASHSWLSS